MSRMSGKRNIMVQTTTDQHRPSLNNEEEQSNETSNNFETKASGAALKLCDSEIMDKQNESESLKEIQEDRKDESEEHVATDCDPRPQNSQEKDINKHDFEAGDHVIRWEINPLLMWPIQTHGIVIGGDKKDGTLVLVDFGWTSISGQSQDSTENNSSSQTDLLNSNDSVVKEWNKQQNEARRFKVVTLTDAKNIKKWHKVNYGKSLFSSEDGKGKFQKFTSWFSRTKKSGSSDVNEARNDEFIGDTVDTSNNDYVSEREGVKMINADSNDDSSAKEFDGENRLKLNSLQSSKPEDPRQEQTKQNVVGSSHPEIFVPLESPTSTLVEQNKHGDIDTDSSYTLSQLIVEANEIEMQRRSKRLSTSLNASTADDKRTNNDVHGKSTNGNPISTFLATDKITAFARNLASKSKTQRSKMIPPQLWLSSSIRMKNKESSSCKGVEVVENGNTANKCSTTPVDGKGNQDTAAGEVQTNKKEGNNKIFANYFNSAHLQTDKITALARNLASKSKIQGSKLSLPQSWLPSSTKTKNKDPSDGNYDSDKENNKTNGKCLSSSSDGGKTQQEQDQLPKLPKSDPRKIVLARVNFILAQQDLPEKISALPPYHILYSNSECLAVWCKTGRFSTLQASVFLHSTAVGNAKGTISLTAFVTATQPWLIPVVAGVGLVAVGMPYMLLKKCGNKWKESEKKLNDGFWGEASHEVFVAAIECWSGLKKETLDTNGEY